VFTGFAIAVINPDLATSHKVIQEILPFVVVPMKNLSAELVRSYFCLSLSFWEPIFRSRYGGAAFLPLLCRVKYVKFVEIAQITLIL
jgi:hypothetical protein